MLNYDAQGRSPLHLAAGWGQVRSKVKLCVEIGRMPTNFHLTPLHLAPGWEQADMIRLLVELGADVSQRTELGDSALHAAAAWGRLDVVEALLDSGADPSALNKMYVAPLDLAREYNYTSMEALLLRRGSAGAK